MAATFALTLHGGSVLASHRQLLTSPLLLINDQTINQYKQSQLNVPISFISNGNDISSVSFTLDYDQTCLNFDALTDDNNDGIPNAISDPPNGFAFTIQQNPPSNPDGTLKVLISPQGGSAPPAVLTTGTVVTFTFTVPPFCATQDGALLNLSFNFIEYGFGSNQGQSVSGEANGGIFRLRFNANPTAITLSTSTVQENLSALTPVGSFDTQDMDEIAPRPGDQHHYTLVNGSGDSGNRYFTIQNEQLLTLTPLDYEDVNRHSILVRSTDSFGGMITQTFSITVSDANEAPDEIRLDRNQLAENSLTPTQIGTLSTNDPDNFTYVPFLPGDITESTTYRLPVALLDNRYFRVGGNQLQATTSFNYELKSNYLLQVLATDSANHTISQTITIVVNNANDAPVAKDDPGSTPPWIVTGDGIAVPLAVLNNDVDEDGNTLAVSSVPSMTTRGGTLTNLHSSIGFLAPLNYHGTEIFSYTVADNGVPSLSARALVTVNVVANHQRGDCNQDGLINAADFPALVLEIFDNDEKVNGKPAWWRIFAQGFYGSPRGCDANASRNGFDSNAESVQASDIICTALIYFGNTACTNPPLAVAEQALPAKLSLDRNLSGKPGNWVTIPIHFSAGGNQVFAAAFALDFDPSRLVFDPADQDQDGVPDALTLHISSALSKSVHFNSDLSRLEIALYNATLPIQPFDEGTIATLQLQIRPDASVGSTDLNLQIASLSDDQGQNVALETINGQIAIVNQTAERLFLPVVSR